MPTFFDARSTPRDPLSAAVRVWTVYELLMLLFVEVLPHGQPTPWAVVSYGMLLGMCVYPSRSNIALALVHRLYDTWSHIPVVFDMYYWCFQTDAALLFLLLLAPASASRASLATWWARMVRVQLAFFYGAAAYWKLNTSFLTPRVSCAPMFFLTLLPTLGFTPPPGVAYLIAQAAPAVTILGEASIAFFMLNPSPKLVRFGIVLALVLHLGIAMTPPPNNATPFSVVCIVRFLVTESEGLAATLEELRTFGTAAKLTAGMAVVSASVSTGVAYARVLSHPPGLLPVEPDLFIAMYAFLMVVCARALMLAPSGTFGAAEPLAPKLRACLVGVAFMYSFGLPILGLMDQGSCNMYSNLLLHGKGNHLISLTDLLPKTIPAMANAFATVRVETTTSAWMNSMYPSEITTMMSPLERRLLRGVGHRVRMFNSMKTRILGPDSAPPRPPGPFLRYTVPALEFRRLLKEARAQNESFSVTYTVLDGDGDEIWRRGAAGRTVTLVENGAGNRACSIARAGPFKKACDPGEIALLPPPGWLASKLLLQQPYPIIEEETEDRISCFGP